MSPQMGHQVSLRTAYLIMFEFLECYWERGGKTSDEIGGLLGNLSLLADRESADPAMISDWLDAATTVIQAEKTPEGYRGADLELTSPEEE